MSNSETLREQFMKAISKDRQFQEAKKSGKAFIIVDWQSLDADGNWLERDRATKLRAKREVE